MCTISQRAQHSLNSTASYCEAGACWFVVLSLSTGPSSNICSLTMGLLRPSATCARKKIIICSDNGLSPSRRQALICTNAWHIVNSTTTNKLQWNINCNSCIFIPNRHHEQAVMKLWHVTNIIGMSIHKELLIPICTMHYVAISIRVCEVSLWQPLRHATGGLQGLSVWAIR